MVHALLAEPGLAFACAGNHPCSGRSILAPLGSTGLFTRLRLVDFISWRGGDAAAGSLPACVSNLVIWFIHLRR